MQAESSIVINASPEAVWMVISDIENSAATISGIQAVEILKRPDEGILGLRWRETRMLGGRAATETMSITEAVEAHHYVAEASSHGSVYRSEIRLARVDEGTRLSMHFQSVPQNLVTRVITTLFTPIMKRAIRKAFDQDLRDIKAAVERRPV